MPVRNADPFVEVDLAIVGGQLAVPLGYQSRTLVKVKPSRMCLEPTKHWLILVPVFVLLESHIDMVLANE